RAGVARTGRAPLRQSRRRAGGLRVRGACFVAGRGARAPRPDRVAVTDLAAGGFSAWAAGTRRAQTSDDDAAVPCDGCTACCRSSFFVHIEPDETATLQRVPRDLLFPAPGRPRGHVAIGYD